MSNTRLKFRQFIECRMRYWGFLEDGGFIAPILGHDSEQFTGLCGRNGVEIYEGDILADLGSGLETGYGEHPIFILKWCPFNLEFVGDIKWYSNFKLTHLGCSGQKEKIRSLAKRDKKFWKKIGNIHQNPELL